MTYWTRSPSLLFLVGLGLLAPSCNADLVDQLGSANPTLYRLAGPGQEEMRGLVPAERYRAAYKSFLSETGNLARGAEEESELRARNAASRIVAYLVLMLGAVDDSAMEGRIVDAMRAFIRMGESLVLGRREPGKAKQVRRLRDHWGEILHPGNVTHYSPLEKKPLPRPPKGKPRPEGGKGRSSHSEKPSSPSSRQ